MGVKSDDWIRQQARAGMIEPFEEDLVSRGAISFGVSSYGYDMRLARDFRIFEPAPGVVLDPKSYPDNSFREFNGAACEIPAHSFVLARSLEYFRIPRSVVTVCFGKSTYARCGVIVNVTPFEPEWEGFVTMSIVNVAPVPARIYAAEGIAQVLFFEADSVCSRSYRDRKGKYQAQQGIVTSRIDPQ